MRAAEPKQVPLTSSGLAPVRPAPRVVPSSPRVVRPELMREALAALERHGSTIKLRDRIVIADFSAPSSQPRFHFIDLVSGTSRGIRLRADTVRTINAARGASFALPLTALAPLVLPLVGRVAAGSPILAQEHIDQSYSVEPSLFAAKPDYLLKVRGMSMRDAGIMDGDLLAVQATHEARNGQIVVARLGDDVTVKRFKRTPQGIELLPENPDYKIIHVDPEEPFAIEGLAVGLIRNSMFM
jgi:repressor LexA